MLKNQKTLQEALQHHHAGRLAMAEPLYRQVLAHSPNNFEALMLLGTLLNMDGRPQEALPLLQNAVALRPAVAEAHANLANAFKQLRKYEEALSAYREAAALNPRLAGIHNNVGNILQEQGRLEGAIACFRDALAVTPAFPDACFNLGNALRLAGRFDEAISQFRRALELRPDHIGSLFNLANAYRELDDLDQAVEYYRRALATKPDHGDALCNLGIALQSKGLLDECIACHRQALKLKAPNAHSNLLFDLQYHPDFSCEDIFRESLRWEEIHARPLAEHILPHANERDPERPLRIGYVSADLRMHSVAFFLLPLLEAHDKQQFHVTCYTTNPLSDHVTERFRACSDVWRTLAGVADEPAAERIRNDRIDILIDLNGHTSGNRLLLFARKPAPVQVSYLGFAGTTGLHTIDYRLTDAFADPPGIADRCHTERLVRLPGTAWCFTPLSGAPPVSDLSALRSGHITFGSLNNLAKLTSVTMDLWSRILQLVPTSQLLLKSPAFRSAETIARFRKLFADRGIEPRRLALLPKEPTYLRHLQIYDSVDIALDAFPYHGTTTTCEALWMGVPVVTLAGDRHASRVGVSLLTNMGLSEMIAHSEDEYVRIALGLAEDLPRLAELRRTLRARMRASPLMDGPRFAAHAEAAYREMWRRWCVEIPALQ